MSSDRFACAWFLVLTAGLVGCSSSEADPPGDGGAGSAGTAGLGTAGSVGQSGAGNGGTAQAGAGTGGVAQGGAGSGGSATGGAGTGGAVSAGAGGSGGSAVTTVSYRTTIKPLFEANCTICHYTGSATIDIQNPFAPVTGLVNAANTWAEVHPEGNTPARNVVPGDPDNSFLMQKISATTLDPATAGEPMPWAVPRVTEAEVTALREWIAAGALDDAMFMSNIRPIFGREGSLTGKCVHCHWSQGEWPNLQDPWNASSGAVGALDSLGTEKVIDPGNPDASFLITKVSVPNLPPNQGRPMPYQFPRLTAAEVLSIRTWISEGALDN